MKFLMCYPGYNYEISYEINPWMDKKIVVDKDKAINQWESLYNIIVHYLGEYLRKQSEQHCRANPYILECAKHLPDMVFTANAGLPYKGKVVVSNFKYPERQKEQQHFLSFFENEQGYETLVPKRNFEGAGDAIFSGELLFAGYGFRTEPDVYEEVADFLDINDVILCELKDPRFYHLDTCFCPIKDDLVMCYPGAFSKETMRKIGNACDVIAVSEDEALKFTCNSVVIDDIIFMPSECDITKLLLDHLGFKVCFCDMSEFLKSGGGCRCLVLNL